jgi:hypothetical protein
MRLTKHCEECEFVWICVEDCDEPHIPVFKDDELEAGEK